MGRVRPSPLVHVDPRAPARHDSPPTGGAGTCRIPTATLRMVLSGASWSSARRGEVAAVHVERTWLTATREPPRAARGRARVLPQGEANAEGWSMLIAKGRGWESAYRDRWRHDKVVRSTRRQLHGLLLLERYVRTGSSRGRARPSTTRGRTDRRITSRAGAARRVVLLVHLLARPPEVPVRARACSRPGARPRRRPRTARGLRGGRGRRRRRARARARRPRALLVGGGDGADRRRDRAHDPRARSRPRRRLPPIPAMSPVSFAAGSRFLGLIGGQRRSSTTGTRISAGLAADVRRRDGRPESADWWDAAT